MRTISRAVTVLGVFCASVLAGGSQAGAGGVVQVKAFPENGHPGDIIDLSGTGLPANTRIRVLMACPNIMTPGGIAYGNVLERVGPITDSHGTFAGFLFPANHVSHIGLPNQCQIYVGYDNVGFANPIPALYYIYKQGKRFANRCEAAMCVRVTTRPSQARAGYREHIAVDGWGGAHAVVRIKYAHAPTLTTIRQLDWQGKLSFTVPIPSSTRGNATVSVYTRLAARGMDPVKASSNSTFTVLH